MKQNDSSEFLLLLFEFLVKFGKNQDLKRRSRVLSLASLHKENPASMVEKHVCKKNFSFGSNEQLCNKFTKTRTIS